MPALTAKQRLKLLERVFKEGVSVSSACREFGVSRFTFYKWAKKYEPNASRNQNLNNLQDEKRKIKRFAGQASQEIEDEVKKLASENPQWSKYKIAEELQKRVGEEKAVGVHGVYNVLKRAGLSTSDKRKAWREFVFQTQRAKRRILTPEQRLKVIKRAVKLGVPVARVCRDFGISRQTFYKWKRRWEKEGRRIDALRDKKPLYDRDYLRVKPEHEKVILSLVIEFPELSKYGLAQKVAEKIGPVTGVHGVYNVLLRNGLNRPNARHAYAQIHAPEVPAPITWIDRVRYVLEQFVPSLAPAPPSVAKAMEGKPVFIVLWNFLKPFFISLIISTASSYSLIWWVNLVASQVGLAAIGLVFASIALFMGSFFFLYSLKYYLTLAIVLSFSQQEVNSNSSIVNRNGRKRNLLSWILGLNGHRPGGASGPEGEGGGAKAVGLTPNLEHIKLKRYPYISIHIPFYNEKNVVERSIKAATNFDYGGEYEIILCDDSTDETSQIIRDYLRKVKGQMSKVKGDGYTLTSAEVRPGVTVKHLHRTSRSGFKGGALRLALRVSDPRAEFISVFDADFVPYPDTLELFLKYFQVTAGTLDFKKVDSEQWTVNSKPKNTEHQTPSGPKALKGRRPNTVHRTPNTSNIAAVQGYQWHVLNKSENWITRGVRTEYAGSYVIERSGREIYGALKQISGAVYMIRRDVLEEVGWETSITEDFQLTLKLYEAGYKVVYTPYIQAPAECVSTLKRLIRQRMRWAEGHSNNIRRMFIRLMFGKWEMRNERLDNEVGSEKEKSHLSPQSEANQASHITPHISRKWTPSPLTLSEKLEFLYLSPYYLQAFFFLVGTISWLISETLFPARLPFWTSLWGWSLVLTNLISLPLMNAVGLFLEESEERDYLGIASFFALSYIVVPFQAYASVKGFLQKKEGPWFRTPKTGRITDVLKRGTFYRFISGILPGRVSPSVVHANKMRMGILRMDSNKFAQFKFANNSHYLSLATANSQFNSFKLKPKRNRYIAKLALFFVVGLSAIFSYFGNRVPQGAISNLPIQAWVEVTNEDNSVVSQAVNLLKPKDALASSFAEAIFTGTSGTEILGYVFILTVILSLAFLLYLIRRKRRLLRKIIRPLFVLVLIVSWLLASWPPILTKPPFPPKIKEAQAATVAVNGTPTAELRSGTNQWTLDHNSPTGSNTMILVSVTLTNDQNYEVSSVYYDSQLLTQIDRAEDSDDAVVDMWYRLNPSTGTNTVEVNFNGTVAGGTLGAISFTGVDQEDAHGTTQKTNGDLNPIYVTVDSETDGMVFSGVACETCGTFSVDDEDVQWSIYDSPVSGAASTQAGAATVEMRWSSTGTDHTALLAVPINPAAVVDDATVSTSGTQTSTMSITSQDNYVGGMFIISASDNRTVTGITIAEQGSVNASTGLDNIELYYETSSDCTGESYGGGESQFGSTDTDGFDGINGESSFSGSVAITSTSEMCVYVILDITSSANDDETLEIQITDPATDVTLQSGTPGPSGEAQAISGTTELQSPSKLDQEHYRWRNDTGGETGGASSQVTATTDTTTDSLTDELMVGMTITPGAGDYLIWFTSSVESDTENRRIFVSIYVGGNPLAHTEREIFIEGSYDVGNSFVVNTHARRLTVGASDAIEVQWRITGGTATATAHDRTLVVEEITAANSSQASDTINDTRNLDTYALMDNMTLTPGAGDYLVWFSASLESDSGVSVTLVSIFAGGNPITHSERQLDSDSSFLSSSVPIASHARALSVGAVDAIEVRWRTSDGTATVHERTLVVKKINSGNSDEASATIDDTHDTDTYTLMGSMTLTPGAGDYHVWFSGSVENSAANSTQRISIFVGGVQIDHTERQMFTEGSGTGYSYPGVSTHARLTGVGVADAIEIRWRTTAATATVHERTLTIYDLSVQHEETLTGSSNTTDTVTVANVSAGVDQLYLAAIAIYQTNASILSVSGGSGLVWTLKKRQCAARIAEPWVEIWQAFGSPGTSFTVTATSDTNPSDRLSMAVSRFSGADITTPTEGASGSNTNGQGAAATCVTGTDDVNATLSLTSSNNNSVHYVATHPRIYTISTADTDYSQRAFISNSSGGDGANLYIHDRRLTPAGTDTCDHTLSSAAAWDMAGLVINPANLGGAAATFAKDEDTEFTDFPRNTTYRLRFLVFNEGGATSGNVTYRLQVAQAVTCSSGSYGDVAQSDGGSDHWEIVDSIYVTDGEATTNVPGGLTDPGTGSFEPGELRDDNSNTTGNIELLEDKFTEIEFAIQATDNSLDLTNYCFRLYDSTGATALDAYTNYAEAVVVPEYTWIFFGLGPFLPLLLKRKRKR